MLFSPPPFNNPLLDRVITSWLNALHQYGLEIGSVRVLGLDLPSLIAVLRALREGEA
jgi:hypothetical protein